VIRVAVRVPPPARGRTTLAALACAALVLAGCTTPARVSGELDSPAAQPCYAPPPGPAPAVPSAAPSNVPDLRLPCLAGDAQVHLAALRRPAVVNLWASWCAPCRLEMPAIQRYAARVGIRVAVLGVDTGDTRTGAGSVIQDLKITYPNLDDDRQLLLHALGRTGLPVTLFIDAQGGVRHVYSGPPLTESSLAGLVATHLGVAL
jgi:thiol-disulfide isomerase/thioredoxin